MSVFAQFAQRVKVRHGFHRLINGESKVLLSRLNERSEELDWIRKMKGQLARGRGNLKQEISKRRLAVCHVLTIKAHFKGALHITRVL
jgi:hypothetical protein